MDFVALAQQCAPLVAPQTMAAIVKTESGFRPLAININGGGRLERQPSTKAEAVATAQWLIDRGYSIDMGLGQVNSKNLPGLGITLDDVFEPCANLTAAATILHGNYQAASRQVGEGQTALRAALSAYNTGSFSRGFANGYVQTVLNNAATTPGATVQTATHIPLAAGAKPAKTRKEGKAPPAVHMSTAESGDQAAPDASSPYVFGSGAYLSEAIVYR